MGKKKLARRTFAWILVIAMLLDVLPVNTYAYAAYVPTGTATVMDETQEDAQGTEDGLQTEEVQPEQKEAPTIYLMDPTAQPENNSESLPDDTTQETVEEQTDSEQDVPEAESAVSEETQSAQDTESADADGQIEEQALEGFAQSETIDGVKITVTADAGVFPAGAALSVRKADRDEAIEVMEAVDEAKEESSGTTAYYTFDIKVLDSDGNELEPDTEAGKVNVSFEKDELAGSQVEASVFHVEENVDGLKAEELGATTEGEVLTAETDGFSFYTLVVTTETNSEYVLHGNPTETQPLEIAAAEIMNACGQEVPEANIIGITFVGETPAAVALGTDKKLEWKSYFEGTISIQINYTANETTASTTCSLTCLANYVVNYDANVGTGEEVTITNASGTAIVSDSAVRGESVTLPTAVREDYYLKGWSEVATATTDILSAGGVFIPSQDVTLYAQWALKTPVQIVPIVTSKTFGESDPVLAYTVSGESITLTGSLKRNAGEMAGNYDYDLSDLDAKNPEYKVSLADEDARFEITKIAFNKNTNLQSEDYYVLNPDKFNLEMENEGTKAIVSSDGAYIFGYTGRQIEPKLILTYPIASETVRAALVSEGAQFTTEGAYILKEDVDYKIADGTSAAVNSSEEGDYLFKLRGHGNFANGMIWIKWNIAKVPLHEDAVKISGFTGEYDGMTHTVTVEVLPEGTTIHYGETADNCTGEEPPEYINCGEHTVYYQITAGEDCPYEGSLSGSAVVNITKKPVEIAVRNATKVYCKDPTMDPVFTYDYTADKAPVYGEYLVGIQNVRLTRAAGEDVAVYPITMDEDVLEDLNNANTNYTITVTPGAFSITKKPVTITISKKTKVYGDPNPELEYTQKGLLDGDVLTGKLICRTGDQEVGLLTPVGSDCTIEADNITAWNENNPNYQILWKNAKLTITQRSIANEAVSVTLDGEPTVTYRYDGIRHSPTVAMADTLSGEAVVLGESDYQVGGTYTATDFGNYTITITGKGNYKGSRTAKWAIKPSINETVTYDGEKHYVTIQLPEIADAYESVTYFTVDQDGNRTPWDTEKGETPWFKDAGEYKVSYDVQLTGDYVSQGDENGILSAESTLTIEPKPIQLAAVSLQKGFGMDEPAGLASSYKVITGGAIATVPEAGSEEEMVQIASMQATIVSGAASALCGDDTLQGITVSRTEGNDAGEYRMEVSVDENAENPNYRIDTVKVPAIFSIGAGSYPAEAIQALGCTEEYSWAVAGPQSSSRIYEKIKADPNLWRENVTSYSVKSVSDSAHILVTGSAVVTTGGALTYELTGNTGKAGLSATITVTVHSRNYEDFDADLTIVTLPAEGTINWVSSAAVIFDKTYDGVPVDFNSSTYYMTNNLDAGTAVTVTYYSNAACTEVIGTTGPKDAGTYWVKAEIANSDNYKSASTAAKEFTIRKKAVNVDVKAANDSITRVYEAGNKAATVPELYIADAETATGSGILAGTTGVSGEAFKITGLTGNYRSENVEFETSSSIVTSMAVTINTGSAVVSGTSDSAKVSNYVFNYDTQGVRGTITQRPIVVTADNKQKVHGANDPALTYTVSGAASTITLGGITLSRAEGEHVGEYGINVADNGTDKNYNITKVNGKLTILPRRIEVDLSKVNGDQKMTRAYNSTDIIGLPDIEITDSSDAEATSGGVVCAATGVSGEAFVIRGIKGRLVSGAGVVYDEKGVTGQAVVISDTTACSGSSVLYTITGEGITITPKNVTTKSEDYEIVYRVDGVKATVEPKTVEVDLSVANDVITKVYDGSKSTTVSIPSVYIGDGSTTPPAGAIVAGSTGVEGETFVLSDLAGYFIDGKVFYENGSVSKKPFDSIKNIDQATVNPGEATNPSNYSFKYKNMMYVKGTITPRPVTAAAIEMSKTYGDPDPVLSYAAVGLVNGDTLEGITLTRAEGEDVGTYPITVRSDATKDKNYLITVTDGAFTITKKQVVVDLSKANEDPKMTREYDGTNTIALPDIYIPAKESDVVSGTVVGAFTGVSGEAFKISGITGQFENADAQDGLKAVTIDGVTESGEAVVLSGGSITVTPAGGTKESNYEILYKVQGVKGKIRPKTIDAVVEAQDKIYDGTTDATVTITVTPEVGAETVEVADVPGAFASKDVQYDPGTMTVTAQAVTVSTAAITASGSANLANYKINYKNQVSAKILPKTAQAVVVVADKTYDGTTGAAVSASLTDANGIVTGESFAVSGLKAYFADKNVALASNGSVIAKDVTVITSGATVTALNTPQAVVGNYEFSYDSDVVTKQAIIRKKDAKVITDKNQSKVYLTTEPALTYKVTGLVSGEALQTDSVTVSRAAVNPDPVKDEVGVYPINTVMAPGTNPNYDVEIVTGETFEIKKAPNPWVKTPEAVEIACTEQSEQTYSFADLISGAGIEGLGVDKIVSYSAVEVVSGEGVIARKGDGFDAEITTGGVLKFKLDRNAVSKKTTEFKVNVTNQNYEDLTLSYIVKTKQGTGTVAFRESETFRRPYNGEPINWEFDTNEWPVAANPETRFETNNSEALTSPGAITFSYKGQTDAEIASGAATCSKELTSAPKDVGKYEVTVTVATTDSFTAATTSAAFEITPKELTIDVKARDKVYDGTTKVDWTATVDTGVEGEYISVKEIAAEFDSKDVGERTVNITPTVSGSAFTLLNNSKTDLKNYNVQMVSGSAVTAKITPKKLSAADIEVEVSNKAYDGKLTVSPEAIRITVKQDALVSGESIAINGVSGTYENENAGEKVKVILDWKDAVVTLVGSSSEAVVLQNNAEQDNYVITYPQIAYGKVTKAENIVTGLAIKGWKYGRYDAIVNAPEATAAYGDVKYEYKKESASDDTYSAAVPKDAGLYQVRATVAGSDNYKAATSEAVTFTVSRSAITIKASDKTKAYNAQPAALSAPKYGTDYTVEVDDDNYFSADDKLNVTLTTPVTAGSQVGTYEIVPAYVNTNYQATLVTGAYYVTKVDLAVDAQGYTGEYDGKEHSASIKLSAADKSASDAKIYVSTGAALDATNYETLGKAVSPESITLKDAGTTTVYYYVATGNYDPNPLSGSAVITIRPKKLTAVAAAKDKVYDGNTEAEVTAKAETNIAGEKLAITGISGVFEDAGVGTDKAVIISGAAVVKGEGTTKPENYEVSIPESAKASITKAANKVTVSLADWTYGEEAKIPVTTADFKAEGEPVITYSSTIDGTYTTEVPTEAGHYYVKAKVADTADYEAASGTDSFEISPAAMIVSDAGNVVKTYDGTAYGITVNVENARDAKVYYSTEELTDANIQAAVTMKKAVDSATDEAVTLKDAGELTVYYYVVSNNYTADKVSGSAKITINPKPVTFTWGTTQFTYDETAKSVTAAAVGLVEGDEVTVGAYDDNTKTQAGTYTAVVKELGGRDKDNYTFEANGESTKQLWSIAQATAVVKAEGYTGIYDGKAHGISVSVKDNNGKAVPEAKIYYATAELTADTLTGAAVSGTDESVMAKDAGSKTIYYFVTSDNYKVAEASGSAVIDITPKPVTLSWGEDSFTYDGKTKKIEAVINKGVIGDDDVKVGAYEKNATAKITNSAVSADAYLAKVQNLSGAQAGNYTIATDSAVRPWTIAQAANSVEIIPEGWTYGETAKTPKVTADFGADTAKITYSDNADGTYSETVPADAGTWYTKAEIAATSDYAAAVSSPSAFEVRAAKLNVTAEGYKGIYDGQAHGISVTAAALGLANDDVVIYYSENELTKATIDAAITDHSATTTPVTRTDAGKTKVYYYVMTSNYDAYPVSGSEEIEIGKKEVSFTWQEETTFKYDAAEKTVTAKIMAGGVIGSDDVSVGTYTGNKATKAGEYTAKVTALTGARADNYTFDPANAVKEWKITQENMIATAADVNAVYDGQAHGISVTLDPSVANEATVYYSTAEITKENLDAMIKVGTAVTDPADAKVTRIQAGTTKVYYYVDSENYAVAGASGSADVKVAQKEVTFTWTGTEGLVYDGTEKVVKAAAAGLVSGEAVDVTIEVKDQVRNTVEHAKNAGQYSAKVTGLAGKDAANYTFKAAESTASTIYTIAKAAITVKAEGVTETYDGRYYGISVTAEGADGKAVEEAEIYYSKVTLTAANLNATVTAGNAVTDAKDSKVTRKDAGTSTIWYYVVADNYDITTPGGNAKIVIGKKPVGFTWSEDTFTFDGNEKQITAEAAKEDIVKGDLVAAGTYEQNGNSTNHAVNAGEYTASVKTLTGEDAANYEISAGTATKTWKIQKASNNVKATMTGWIYGEDANKPEAEATFGQDTAVFTYSSDKVNYTDQIPQDAGTWYVIATIPETDNYGGAVSAPAEFKIRQAALNISSKGYEGIYDGQAHGITVNTANAADAVVYYSEEELTKDNIAQAIEDGRAVKEPITRSTAGTTTVYYYVATANYSAYPVCGSETIRIEKKEVSLIWQNETEFGYDASEKSVGATVSGNDLVGTDEVTVGTYSGNKATAAGVYTAKAVSLAGEMADNYTIAAESASKEWKIVPAQMTVTAEGSKGVYDGQYHGITVKLDTAGVPNDAEVYYSTKELTKENVQSMIQAGLAVNNSTDLAVTEKNAKATTIYYYVDTDNFEADHQTGSAQIVINEKEVGFTWNGTQGLVYDGTTKSVTAQVTGVVDTDEVKVGSYEGNTAKNAGDYTATVKSLTGRDAANYTFDTAKASAGWKIAKDGLAVEAKGYQGTYDGNAHGVSVTADVKGNPDADVTIYYSESELTAENIEAAIASGSALTTAITATDAGTTRVYYYVTTDNYEADHVSGSVDIVIAKKKAGINWQSVTEFTYDGRAKTVEATVTGAAGSDELSVAAYEEDAQNHIANSTAAAGEYTARITGLAGAKAANYTFDAAEASKKWTILPAAITITAADKTSRYQETIETLTYEVGGAYVAGDELGITVSTTATDKAGTGTYPITVTWNNNSNYTATIQNGTYTITKSDKEAAAIGEITVVKASEEGKKDAAIEGLNDTMEYSKDGGNTWIPVPQGATSITNLEAGTYLIRVAADANHDAGKPVSVNVEVKTYAQDGDEKTDTDELKDTYKDVKPAEGSVMDTENLTIDEVIDRIAKPSTRKELIEKALANDNGAAAVEVVNEDGSPVKAALNTSYADLINELLSADELIQVMAGAKVKLELVISPSQEKDLDNKVKEGVLALKKDDESVLYFEADLYKLIAKAGETEVTSKEHITEIRGSMSVTVDIPAQIRSKGAEYRLVRNHVDEATGELTTEVMQDTDSWDYTYTFVTDRLCTMAYIYSNDKEAAAAAKAAQEAKEKAEAEAKAAQEAAALKLENELSLNGKIRVAAVGMRFVLRWGKVTGADGYEIYAGSAKGSYAKEPVATTKAGNKSATIRKIGGKKIDTKKAYKFYVRAYKMVDGEKVTIVESIPVYSVSKQNSRYTNAKHTRIKKKSVTIKVGQTSKISAKTVLVSSRKKALKAPVKELRYSSSDAKVATVDENGTITAVGAGTCTIWVYARNGNAQKVKVTVK